MILKKWIQASRVPSQFYIFFPLLLGQAIAWSYTGHLNRLLFVLIQLFGIFDQLYIVYANDYADLETDRKNKTYTIFSGGSRVLVEDKISRKTLGIAAILMAFLTMVICFILTFLYKRPLAIPAGVLALILLHQYSFPPFKLSYRGCGELLQMAGVGTVLPIFAFYIQTGQFAIFPWHILSILCTTNLASGITTSLPDEPSDREGNKRTVSVWAGIKNAKKVIIVLNAISTMLFLFFSGKILTNSILPITFSIVLATTTGLCIINRTHALPGTRHMNYFVTLSVVHTILTTIFLTIVYFYR